MGTKMNAEQIGTNGRFRKYNAGQRKYLKRMSSKIFRRIGKLLLDMAPRKLPLRGYDD